MESAESVESACQAAQPAQWPSEQRPSAAQPAPVVGPFEQWPSVSAWQLIVYTESLPAAEYAECLPVGVAHGNIFGFLWFFVTHMQGHRKFG